MYDPHADFRRAHFLAYWKRNSFSTCVVLTCVSLISLWLFPKGLPLLASGVVSGALAYFGFSSGKWWGSVLGCAALLVPVWPVWEFALSTGLVWILIITPMGATVLGLHIFVKGSSGYEP